MPRSQKQPQGNLPHWNADQLRKHLHQYDRTPFLDLLAAWLECAPSAEDVEAFASLHPDKYINALKNLGLLAGFTEKREVAWTGTLNVNDMSDSQLEDALMERARALGLPVPTTIEHQESEA